MLIESWLDQSVFVIFAILAAALGACAVLVWLAIRWSVARGWTEQVTGVVAPFFGAVSVLFALLTGLSASDAWERNRAAGRAVLAERDAVVALHELSIATVSDMAVIRAALRDYLEAVVTDEWPLMRDRQTSARAGAELSRLLGELAAPKISVEAGLVAHQTLLQLWQKVHGARTDRLALSEQGADHAKWLTVFILAVLTQIAVGIVHAGKPAAMGTALAVFTVAAVSTLGFVAIKERPFDGPLATPPAPFVAALARLATPSLRP